MLEGWADARAAGYCLQGSCLGGVGTLPGLERSTAGGTEGLAQTQGTLERVSILPASSSAAQLLPTVPTDPEPGALPQEARLDVLPGELTTLWGFSGEMATRKTVQTGGLSWEVWPGPKRFCLGPSGPIQGTWASHTSPIKSRIPRFVTGTTPL